MKNNYKGIKWSHQIQLPNGEVTPGEWFPTIEEWGLDQINYKNKRVLDVGCLDGIHSFYAERHGAKEVLSIDINDVNEGQFSRKVLNPRGYMNTGYLYAHRALKSKAKYIFPFSVYDLDSKQVGTFDIVFSLGLIYHLAHPILSLEKINIVMKKNGLLVIEAVISDSFIKFYHKMKYNTSHSVSNLNKKESQEQANVRSNMIKNSWSFFLSRPLKVKFYVLEIILKSKLQLFLLFILSPIMKEKTDIFKNDVSNFWLLTPEALEKALDFSGFKIERKMVNPFSTSVTYFCKKVADIDPIYAHKSIHSKQKLVTNFLKKNKV